MQRAARTSHAPGHISPRPARQSPPPHTRPPHPPPSTPRLWSDRRFLSLTAASAFGLFAQIGLVAQLYSLLVPRLGSPLASATMGAATALAILGRSLLGVVMPAGADRRAIAAANVGVQAAGSIVLLSAGTSVPLILLGCALFGLGLGNVTSLPPLVAQADFSPDDVARVVALVTAVSQAGYAFAPLLFGLLRESGSSAGFGVMADGAPPLFIAAAGLQLASGAAYVAGRQRPVPALP